jgi:zinc/manganese transport system ATP-binding protein
MSAIRLADLTLGYDRHPAVHHLSGEIASGSLTAIVGPNGAGKSTLLKGIAGALTPLEGSVSVARGKRLAYLPQSADLDRSFPIHVYDLVAMGLWNAAGIFGRIGFGSKAKVDEAIAAVGLTGFERRPIGTLSGGQMQRMLFARVLLQDARRDRARRAVQCDRRQDIGGPDCAGAPLACRKAHGAGGAARYGDGARAFPETLLLARGSVAWGIDRQQVLTADNLLRGAAHVRSLRRWRRHLRCRCRVHIARRPDRSCSTMR